MHAAPRRSVLATDAIYSTSIHQRDEATKDMREAVSSVSRLVV